MKRRLAVVERNTAERVILPKKLHFGFDRHVMHRSVHPIHTTLDGEKKQGGGRKKNGELLKNLQVVCCANITKIRRRKNFSSS